MLAHPQHPAAQFPTTLVEQGAVDWPSFSRKSGGSSLGRGRRSTKKRLIPSSEIQLVSRSLSTSSATSRGPG